MSGFNPYREWLGLETSSRPTYYELLSIREHDVQGRPLRGWEREHVKITATRHLQHLQQLDPGSRAGLRDQLAKRLTRARETLLDESLRGAYDRRLLQQEVVAVARQQPPQPAPGVLGVAPHSAAKDDVAPLWTPDRPRVPLGRNVRRLRSRQRMRWATATLLVASLIGVAYLAVRYRDGWLMTQASADPVPFEDQAAASARPLPQPAATPRPAPRRVSRNEVETEVGTPQVAIAKPASTVKSPMPAESPPMTEGQQQTRDALWREALRQLEAGDFEEARASLEKTEALPLSAMDLQRQRRLMRLVDYADRYWSAATRALAALKSGDEFDLQGKRVIVVERSDNQLILRSAGRNVRYDLTSLPPQISRLFAERWFDQNAASTWVFRGAVLAVAAQTESQRREVRKLWSRAAATGEVDLGDLDQVLEDLEDLR